MANQNENVPVEGRDGHIGWINPREQTAGGTEVLIRLENGQAILAPKELLVPQKSGGYYIPLSSDQFQEDVMVAGGQQQARETLMVVPVLVEKADIGKKVTGNTVRISKKVKERRERIENTGFTEQVHVEHVPVNAEVQVTPKIRTEGDTTIIPVFEEMLVIQKRVVLREEVRVRVEKVPHEPQEFTLRSEVVEIERPDIGEKVQKEE